MRKITLLLFFLNITLQTNAQKTITGYVYDDIGALAGANIIIKDSTKGTVADLEGNFEIEAKENDTLLVSYLGYNTKEVKVGKQKGTKIKLAGNIALDEVTVVSYGVTRFSCHTNCYLTSKTVGDSIGLKKSNIITESLYPNPSREGRFKLNLLKAYKLVIIQVANMAGRIVQARNYNNINNNKVLIDLSNQPKGMYIINIVADGQQLDAKKAIKG